MDPGATRAELRFREQLQKAGRSKPSLRSPSYASYEFYVSYVSYASYASYASLAAQSSICLRARSTRRPAVTCRMSVTPPDGYMSLTVTSHPCCAVVSLPSGAEPMHPMNPMYPMHPMNPSLRSCLAACGGGARAARPRV